MARSMTPCFGLNEVICVTFNVETYVASLKTNDGVWLCCSIVHRHFCIIDGVSGGRSFFRVDNVEHDAHGGIDGA